MKSKNIPLNIVDQNKLFENREPCFINDFYDCIIKVKRASSIDSRNIAARGRAADQRSQRKSRP